MFIVGEAWGDQEELYQAPFIGPSGFLLRQCLAHVGVDMDDCHLTNVFNFRPERNDIKTLCGPRAEGIPGLGGLRTGQVCSRRVCPPS